MPNTTQVKQYKCMQDRDNLVLIPPLSDEFSVYGGDDTVERARNWALEHHYLLAEGVPDCAHGFYLFSMCPVHCGPCGGRQMDHVGLWVPYSPERYSERPFLLMHPYSDEIGSEINYYAKAHGLKVASYKGDSWYGHGTLPIRLTLPSDYPVWPIERKAALLTSICPVKWPDDDSDEDSDGEEEE